MILLINNYPNRAMRNIEFSKLGGRGVGFAFPKDEQAGKANKHNRPENKV
jgi:hypothetical protein